MDRHYDDGSDKAKAEIEVENAAALDAELSDEALAHIDTTAPELVLSGHHFHSCVCFSCPVLVAGAPARLCAGCHHAGCHPRHGRCIRPEPATDDGVPGLDVSPLDWD